ncbi:NADH-quinone oxidoreductase subunit C [Streptomyces sp. NPDC051041]|uniref:NADH-quinone oxidoreductase subunit C n=1 Tax=Streptomyces sp. NPDC051041 TaxID=3365640 RepID=UPI0037BAD60B
MTAAGWLPADVEELFGAQATAEESYEVLTVDVPPAAWIPALETARDRLGCTYFDWLSAVDEPGTGFRVAAHVAALAPVRRLLLRTTVPHEAPVLPSAVDVYAGAAWHERETHEMFGVVFEGHPALDHLLLPENFEGHPLRKDFVLAARVAKAWPGAKEPGESEHGGPKRRQMLPPGVPDPNEWGPLKGQLPPAPARGARAAGDRPARRTRSAAEGPAGRTAAAAPDTPPAPRRARSASGGSASQRAGAVDAAAEGAAAGQGATGSGAPAAPRRARSASEGSASQRAGAGAPAGPRRARSAAEGSASRRSAPGEGTPSDGTGAGAAARRTTSPGAAGRPAKPPVVPHSPDAPWHHARPAFDEPGEEAKPGAEPGPTAGAAAEAESREGTEPVTGAEPAVEAEPAPEAGTTPGAGGAEAGAPTGKSENPRPPEASGTPEAPGDPEASPSPENPAGGPR